MRSIKKTLSLILLLTAVFTLLPAASVKAELYDESTLCTMLRSYFKADYYDIRYNDTFSRLNSVMSKKGVSQKELSQAMMDFQLAAQQKSWVDSQMIKLINDPGYKANPTKFIANLKQKDGAVIMNEPVEWSTLYITHNKSKYTDAWVNQTYSHSELVNQAAYNGVIGQIGAYATEQGNIAAVTEYRKGNPNGSTAGTSGGSNTGNVTGGYFSGTSN